MLRVPQLGSDEQVVAGNNALLLDNVKCLAHLALILVHACTVDVPIAHANGGLHSRLNFAALRLPRSQPDQRHGVATVQLRDRHRHAVYDAAKVGVGRSNNVLLPLILVGPVPELVQRLVWASWVDPEGAVNQPDLQLKAGQLLHLVLLQTPPDHIDVAGDALRRHALWQNARAALHGPLHQDLARVAAVFVRQARHHWMR
mmetsp:Transcript_21207/g.63527  ORF Transcript_21207/g.63527 Transcript_21207/m.63527 type:complete len:201 (+) Transcript_21207:1013-1615(+)